MPDFREVTSEQDIESVAALANEIWNEHFVDIIGQAQVDYMLHKLQSTTAIASQISQGYLYYLLIHEGQNVGYLAIVPSPDTSSAQISKIYVKKKCRGHGLGNAAIAFVEGLCRRMGLRALWLTVNKNNVGPIAFYEHVGFVNLGEMVQDIGGGFVMDDYKMQKNIAPQPDPPDST
jgi:ribosomal protein S18 acetylase RimI-like enzyme